MSDAGAHVPHGAESVHSSPEPGEEWTASSSSDPGSSGPPAEPANDFEPEDGSVDDAESAADIVAADIAAVVSERDEYRDSLVRLQADFENYKKRVSKQADELRDRAAESLVEKLLPVLDTAELAIAHGGGDGVAQLCATLFSVLEREGLERIDKAGEPFDPNCHDAVAHEPGEGGQEVAEVMRSGYRWRGRVLRPAMVKVRG